MTTRKTTGRFSAGTSGILGFAVRFAVAGAVLAFLVSVAQTLAVLSA